MIEVMPLYNREYEDLLQLLEASVLSEIENILAQFWIPPHEASDQVKNIIRLGRESSLDVVVSGETKNISLYIKGATGILVITPFSSIDCNVLLQEVYGETALPKDCKWYIFPIEGKLLRRLLLPNVLLVNPCVLENFPIPRLCLSIGLIASYLRKYQKAAVHIIDMQVGTTVEDVIHKAIQLQPALFGMSISYGQKYVALSILEEVYRAKRTGTMNPLVVLGNIISASFPNEFIDLYPDLVVATGEGEQTIVGLIEYLNGKQRLEDVPALAYRNSSGKIQYTLNVPVPIDTIPLPALDTIKDLAKWRGALTLELSRGCQWNVCTFCPREHKSNLWKTFSFEQMIEQFKYMRNICDRFGILRHVYLADEEFVGGMSDGLETKRITDFAQTLIKDDLGMCFDAAARVDQVYTPQMDKLWHIKRIEMWHLCRQAGLDRLFMGLESGSISQLQRYGKGIQPEHSIMAIRILSTLGIPLRFGFITFDPLMSGLEDLKRNIAFLERTDAFMAEINVEKYGYEKLFDLLMYDREFVSEQLTNEPIYTSVSYMLASMEVLINSRYKYLLKQAEKRLGRRLVLDEDRPDTNMGRYRVEFVDDLVGDISVSCQKWIDRHFGLAYCVKSLYKVALEYEKNT